MSKLLFKDVEQTRDPANKPDDIAAVSAILQAAVNVELFTIPLYMTSMYSIQGTHKINGSNDFYRGRLWPGMSTTRPVTSPNEDAYNKMFGVFIAEMLHLQLAANMSVAAGVTPSFTSTELQSDRFGWICYGKDITVLPHILDFKDTIDPYNKIRVKLDALNIDQVQLFLAIEETEEKARTVIDPEKLGKYFPLVPFDNWHAGNELPMFGSIGHMYLCLWEYFSLKYSDGSTLWSTMFVPGALQQDIFNMVTKGHPGAEYPEINAVISENESDAALKQMLNMINAITDQGEGSGVVDEIVERLHLKLLTKVQQQFQPSEQALQDDYPSYTDTGEEKPGESSVAAARGGANGAMDHYEIFQAIEALLKSGGIVTWDMWHQAGNAWTADDLKTDGYDLNKYPIPSADEVAGALNRLKQNDTDGKNFKQLSQAAAGAIAGVTKVLNDYWQGVTPDFPYPSMSGSGDRMSICWAIFGKTPDIGAGVDPRNPDILNHSCQGLNLDESVKKDPAACAAVEVYHTCRGSNSCKAEGGCGFVQKVGGGGGGCHAKVRYGFYTNSDGVKGVLCGAPKLFSAPSDNGCAGQGGCAVPVSAAQLFPEPNEGEKTVMQLYDFGEDNTPVKIGTLNYSVGDPVYDVAWAAYEKVMQHRQKTPPPKPAPSDFRLAFPPST